MSENVIETFLKHQNDSYRLDTFKPALLANSANEIFDLERLLEAPLSIKDTFDFDDLRGFVDYLNDFKGDHTVCFAGSEEISAHFDYHKKDNPRWDNHVVNYKIRRSNRWRIWEQAHNKWMSQREFCDFLDTGLNEISEPAQSEILNLVKNFRATINFDVEHEDTPGGTNFTYRKKLKSGSTKQESIEVPEHITITLQPFENLTILNPRIEKEENKIPAYNLKAKINWRVNVGVDEEQTLQFKVQILNFENAIDKTLESLRSAITHLTGVKTYIG